MSDFYVVIDVETTGLSPQRGERVVEIGAVAVDGGKIVDEYHSLIDSGKRIILQALEQLSWFERIFLPWHDLGSIPVIFSDADGL